MIYPNPASDKLIINCADFNPTQIDIFDAIGNRVDSQSVNEEALLNVSVDLPDGIYFVKLSNETHYQLKKIVITNK
jgi:hypothetical protein